MSSKMYDTKNINDIPIRVVAERLGIPMKKKGINMWAHCLWHDDKNASMIVGSNDDRHNICHCFACGANKSVIDLIMQSEHKGWLDACHWIEDYMPEYYDIYKEEIILNKNEKRKIKAKEIEQKVNKNRPQPHKDREGIASDAEEQPAIPIELYIGDQYNSSFARCLKERFGEVVMKSVVDTYKLGAWKRNGYYDDVLFPSIDIKGNIRDLKVQAYDTSPSQGGENSPGFFHSFKKCTYWLGPKLYPCREFDRNCLFGEHLLPLYPDKIVALVESPKNACVGFAQYPQYLWVAVGNKNMLKRSILSVLKGRIVVIFPDEDAYKEWQGKIDAMRDIANIKLFHTPGEGEKRDIADWIINMRIKN